MNWCQGFLSPRRIQLTSCKMLRIQFSSKVCALRLRLWEGMWMWLCPPWLGKSVSCQGKLFYPFHVPCKRSCRCHCLQLLGLGEAQSARHRSCSTPNTLSITCLGVLLGLRDVSSLFEGYLDFVSGPH